MTPLLHHYTQSTVVWMYKCAHLCVCFQKRREREMQQQMECRDEETLELKETYSSLQQEVDIKTKKLKKVEAATLSLLSSVHTDTRHCPVLDAVINQYIQST